jgi:hypothetical protein
MTENYFSSFEAKSKSFAVPLLIVLSSSGLFSPVAGQMSAAAADRLRMWPVSRRV